MPPTSPSHDDVLDFDGLDLKPSGAQSKAAESDFEKELEALFADELASSDEKPASAPPVGAPELEEEALLLDDFVQDAPESAVAGDEDDILDLSAFETGGALDLTPPEETSGGKDGDIDLGGLDDLISGLGDTKPTAPVAAPAAPDENILSPGEPLDDTDMADLLESLDVPKAVQKPVATEPEDELLELSLGDLLEDSPAVEPIASPIAAPTLDLSVLDLELPDLSDPEPGRDLVGEQEQADMGGDLNLSLDDLLAEPASAETAPDTSMDLSLDSAEGMDGLMEGIESSAGEPESTLSIDNADLLSQIPDIPSTEPVLGAPSFAASFENALDLASAPVAEPVSMAELEPAPEPVLEQPVIEQPVLEQPVLVPPVQAVEPLPFEVATPQAAESGGAALAGAALGVAALASIAEPVRQPAPAVAEASAHPSLGVGVSVADQAEIESRLAQLAAQVTGNSVAVMRLEGQLAQREKTLADIEQQLLASQQEAQALRDDLTALRQQLENSLRTQAEDVKHEVAQGTQAAADKSQAAMDKALGAMDKALGAMDKAQAVADKVDTLAPRVESAEMTVRGAGARLAQMEDRQSQLDREVFAEISRAVPREAAKVIREEIAHLAASLHEE